MAAWPADRLHHQPLQIPPPPAQPSRPSPSRRQISSLLASTYSQASSASQTHPSQMALLSLDKENAPPPSAARGIAVKRQTMKRPGGGNKVPRRRPPLRDITRLFVAASCPPPSTAVLLALSDAALPEAVPVRPGSGAGALDAVTVKQSSHSLRMGFR